MSNGKATIISLTVGLTKKIFLYKVSYFPELYTYTKNRIKLEVDFSNYVTKLDIKSLTGVNTSGFAKKVFLANLKSEVINKILINQKKCQVI